MEWVRGGAAAPQRPAGRTARPRWLSALPASRLQPHSMASTDLSLGINSSDNPVPTNDDPEAGDATRLPGFPKMRDATDGAPMPGKFV